MKTIMTSFLFLLTMLSGHANATEYIHRDLMANTLPSVKCETENIARTAAQKPYRVKRYAKKFCQTQGYGWHLESMKEPGKVVCSECTSEADKQRCSLQDVVVTCRRIKLGSVGMLPGKG